MYMKLIVSRTTDGIKSYPVHSHNYWEIMFYINGEGYLHTESLDLPFSKSTAIIVPPGISHGSVSNNEFKNISIGGDFSHLLFGDTPIIVTDNESKDGETLADIIYRNRYGDEKYLTDLSSSYIRFLLQRANLKNDIDNAVYAIYNKISDRAFDSEIDITEILNESGYAEDYIRMCFRNTFGMPPIKFLTKIRMDHACSLLSIYRDSIPLSFIAEKCGYTDYVYFSKTFKTHTGLSPKEYIRTK